MTYTNATPRTRISPSMKKNETSGLNQRPPTMPLASARHSCSRIALVGVLKVGWTLASAFGNEPLRAIPYHMRVPTFAVARQTASVEVKKAARISHHAPPQSLCARDRPGSSSELIRLSTLSTPNPVITPQNVSTRKIPRMVMESITDRGTLRLGSLVSSARGAAASHPVRPWTDSTIASVKPERASLLPKSNTDSE